MNRKTKNRPEISIYIATSIDSYIARDDGSLDWLDRVNDNEDYGFQKFLDSIDTIILGRKTYEIVTGLITSFSDWPYIGKRVIVLSSSLQTVRKEVELFKGKRQISTSLLGCALAGDYFLGDIFCAAAQLSGSNSSSLFALWLISRHMTSSR